MTLSTGQVTSRRSIRPGGGHQAKRPLVAGKDFAPAVKAVILEGNIVRRASMARNTKDIHNDPVGLIVSTMIFQEECGLVTGLAINIRNNDKFIRELANPEQLSKYNDLLLRAEIAFKYERETGIGSLLNLSHPFTRQLISTGLIDVGKLMAVAEARQKNSHRRCVFREKTGREDALNSSS